MSCLLYFWLLYTRSRQLLQRDRAALNIICKLYPVNSRLYDSRQQSRPHERQWRSSAVNDVERSALLTDNLQLLLSVNNTFDAKEHSKTVEDETNGRIDNVTSIVKIRTAHNDVKGHSRSFAMEPRCLVMDLASGVETLWPRLAKSVVELKSEKNLSLMWVHSPGIHRPI